MYGIIFDIDPTSFKNFCQKISDEFLNVEYFNSYLQKLDELLTKHKFNKVSPGFYTCVYSGNGLPNLIEFLFEFAKKENDMRWVTFSLKKCVAFRMTDFSDLTTLMRREGEL